MGRGQLWDRPQRTSLGAPVIRRNGVPIVRGDAGDATVVYKRQRLIFEVQGGEFREGLEI